MTLDPFAPPTSKRKPTASELAVELGAILKINGRIPRRAVLAEGGKLEDRTACRDAEEVELVSRLCEVARRACGQPVFSRHTPELLDAALASNLPAAWECVCDDILTNDLDLEAAAAMLRRPSNSSALISCLIAARDTRHMLHVATLLSRTLSMIDEESRAEMGRALACQLRPLVDALVTHGALLSRDVRDCVLDGFGRIMADVRVPGARVAECVAYVLERKRDELLRLFFHVSASFAEHQPGVVGQLLARMREVPKASRYPLLALLARIVTRRPDIVVGHERSLAQVIASSIPEEAMDCRECFAAACLAVATAGCGDPLAAALARALRACASALVDMIDKNEAALPPAG